MDHITKTPLRVNDEVAHISKSSPTIFWLKSFFPITIVKIFFRFSSFDKKNRFFQPRSKIPALVIHLPDTFYHERQVSNIKNLGSKED